MFLQISKTKNPFSSCSKIVYKEKKNLKIHLKIMRNPFLLIIVIN